MTSVEKVEKVVVTSAIGLFLVMFTVAWGAVMRDAMVSADPVVDTVFVRDTVYVVRCGNMTDEIRTMQRRVECSPQVELN